MAVFLKVDGKMVRYNTEMLKELAEKTKREMPEKGFMSKTKQSVIAQMTGLLKKK